MPRFYGTVPPRSPVGQSSESHIRRLYAALHEMLSEALHAAHHNTKAAKRVFPLRLHIALLERAYPEWFCASGGRVTLDTDRAVRELPVELGGDDDGVSPTFDDP